jgi:hypothetical protein
MLSKIAVERCDFITPMEVTVMATLVKQHGRYYLQFYDKHRSPQRKRVALKVTRKREAKKHQRRLEDAYRDQEFDPWTDDPFTFQKKDAVPETIEEATEAFLSAKKDAGRSENAIRSSGSNEPLCFATFVTASAPGKPIPSGPLYAIKVVTPITRKSRRA